MCEEGGRWVLWGWRWDQKVQFARKWGAPRLRPNFVGTCFRINSSKTFYFMGTESSQTSTRLRGNFIFAPSGDSCFGPEPASPTENIFVDSGTATLYFESEVALAHNRTIKIAANSTLGLGASRNFVINSLIKSENSPGCAFSTNTFTSISGTWGGTTIFDPGEGRTNIVGHLRTTGRLRIASGVTYVGGGKSSGVGSDVFRHLRTELVFLAESLVVSEELS